MTQNIKAQVARVEVQKAEAKHLKVSHDRWQNNGDKGGITMDVREMAKYIDREALVEWLKRIPLKDLSDGRGICRVIFEDDFKRAIKKIPKGIIVDVAPVRHGRWERTADGAALCTACKRKMNPSQYGYAFCSLCGAKMDGGED